MGVAVALAFGFTQLPEVSEDALQAQEEVVVHTSSLDSDGQVAALEPFYKQYRAITGFVAQFLYVGAQVTIGSSFLNYSYSNAGIPDARGSQLLSCGLITFTVARFIGIALLSVVSALLAIYAAFCVLLALLIGSLKGMAGVVCLILIMFFESIVSYGSASSSRFSADIL